MDILKISSVAIVGVFLCLFFKKDNPQYGLLLMLTITVLVISIGIVWLQEIKDKILELSVYGEETKGYFALLFKVIGITCVCEFTSAICKDAGFSALAEQVRVVGKLLVLATGLPILLSMLELIGRYSV